MQAIGFSTGANGVGPDSSAGLLEAQLNKYQIQLADWCACPSGKTPAGKEKIQDLQSKVDSVKARLDQIQTQRQSSAATKNRDSDLSAESNPSGANQDNSGSLQLSSGRRTTITTLGGFVDVFA